jgi:cobalamin biosynthesis Mg chelatase CobN
VKCEAIITQLIFEHSLRIRVKAEVEKNDDKEQTQTAETSAPDSPMEPGHTEGTTDVTAVAEGSESASVSRSATESTIVHSSSTSVSEPASDSAKKGKKKDDGDSLKKGTRGKATKEDKKAETRNLVGKINNLVTTDLSNIMAARDFMLVFVLSPIQSVLCVVFLYMVLGWR